MPENKMPIEQDMEKAARDLQAANDQRAGAISALKERLALMLSNDQINISNMSAATAQAHRDAAYAINSACQAIEAHDKLMDMIVHDLTNVIQVHDKVAGHVLQASAYTQTIIALMKEKGLATDEELQATWEKLSKPVSPE